jgi:hypothetical protein
MVLGCGYRERGRFAIVAAPHKSLVAHVAGGAAVVGGACFGATAEFGDDHVIDAAVRDALSRYPGADALANATIVDEGNCIKVYGRAVRLAGP